MDAMDRGNCRYCEAIVKQDSTYPVRQAQHGLDSSYPRCDFHWRFECAVCNRPRHFHAVAYCPEAQKFYCLHCAEEYRAPLETFWNWSYYYRLRCPWDKGWHPALDYAEYVGEHPWRLKPTWHREKIGISTEEEIPSLWDLQTLPADEVSDEDIRRSWNDVAAWWLSRYNPMGDLNREWVIDPVLLDYLGDVHGRRVLDAGCGTGYLARILAERGATVVGVDLSSGLLSKARREETKDPLGIAYHEADLSDLSFLEDRSFDAVVSNVVLQDVRRCAVAIMEISRVLRPGGLFVFSLTHPAFDRPPGEWIREPEDSERVEEWRGLLMGDYFDRQAVSWAPHGKPGALGFHLPLRDYFEALHNAGFVVRRLEEPLPSEEALEKHYRAMADFRRAPNFVVIEALKLNTHRGS